MVSVLGVDVGGTKVAAGPVDRTGAMLAPSLIEPSRTESREAFVAGLTGTLRRAMAEFADFDLGAVGLACAGTVDFRRGVVVTSPNLPLVEVPLAGLMQDALGIPVVLDNDANAALWAEALCGAAAGLRQVVLLALGTGIGGGLLVDGRVYRGAGGAAGELGHMVVVAGGLPCRCGTRGCLEMYASGPALVRYASARAKHPDSDPGGALSALREQGGLTGETVARLAAQGHAGALEAVKQLAGWLGIGLVSVSNIFDPEMVVVGGGVSELGESLLGPARQFMRANAMAPGRDTVQVAPAMLGNKAGLVGAALTAWDLVGGETPGAVGADARATPYAAADGAPPSVTMPGS